MECVDPMRPHWLGFYLVVFLAPSYRTIYREREREIPRDRRTVDQFKSNTLVVGLVNVCGTINKRTMCECVFIVRK